MIFAIVTVIIGVYCVFSGVKTLLTGKLTASEEKQLTEFSQKGARSYRLISAISNIIGGILVIVCGVIEFLEAQKILQESFMYKIIFLVVVLVMVAVLYIARAKCKKMSDDE